jgi:hypothetical protein
MIASPKYAFGYSSKLVSANVSGIWLVGVTYVVSSTHFRVVRRFVPQPVRRRPVRACRHIGEDSITATTRPPSDSSSTAQHFAFQRVHQTSDRRPARRARPLRVSGSRYSSIRAITMVTSSVRSAGTQKFLPPHPGEACRWRRCGVHTRRPKVV